MQRHVIRRQVLEVAMRGSEAQALELQRELGGMCAGGLSQAMDAVFSRHVSSSEHWVIEKCEIDAGTIDLDGIEQGLVAAVARAVEQLLEDRSRGAGPQQADILRRSGHQSVWAAWLHFLATGHLPWWYRLPEGSDLETEVGASLAQAQPVGADALPAAELARALSEPAVVRRLARQFSTAFLAQLLERLVPADASLARQLSAVPVMESGMGRDRMRRGWEQILRDWAVHGRLDAHSVSALTQTPSGSRLEPEDASSGGADAAAAAQRTDSRSREVDGRRAGDGGGAARPLASPRRHVAVDGPMAEAAAADAQLQEGVHVDDAGLVLLHPFLPALFGKLQLAADGTLHSPERAMVLLHYLVTGRRTAQEYSLVLPKLLCNLPPGQTTDAAIAVSDAEAAEAERLLEAVIQHWSALGGTSIDGLRGSFLLRPGLLASREDGDTTLQVEARSYDVLMDRLPWGIGAIRLPWMKNMLWVEWQ